LNLCSFKAQFNRGIFKGVKNNEDNATTNANHSSTQNDIHFIDLKDINIKDDHFLIKGIHTKKK